MCYRLRDTSTKWCCDQDWDEERWVWGRSDLLLKPQLRCALHSVYCAACLHSFCFLASCRFANCVICSLVAGFALMVHGYRIIMLRCQRLITPVIRGKTSLFHDCVLAPRALLKFFSSRLFTYCETTAGFTIVGHAHYFLRITRQWPSTGHYQHRADYGHNQQNHRSNNRRLQRLSRPTWRLTRRSK